MAKKSKGAQVPDPFAPDRTKGVFSRWPKNWSEEIPSTWMFRVYWFISDIPDLPLTECTIRRLTKEDVETMRGADEDLGLHPISYASPAEQPWHNLEGIEMPWFLVVQTPPNDYVEAYMYANRLRLSVEICLRLVGDKYVFLSDPTLFQSGVAGSLTGQYGLVSAEPYDSPDIVKLRFSHQMVTTLQLVHSAALAVAHDRTRTGLTRFSRGYGGGGDDALIDYWIGLEALFGDRSGEITYKAAMRIARYVGSGRSDRQFLFRALKASYDARSALVHGSHLPSTTPARRIASYALRMSLVGLLTTHGVIDVGALDDAIAGAGY